MNNQERITLFKVALEKQLNPTQLEIEDESHLHADRKSTRLNSSHRT